MQLARENAKPIDSPSAKQIERALRSLHLPGPPAFASLTDEHGNYIQVGGGGQGCMIEYRDAVNGHHWRAWQDKPIVPFPDGSLICFTGGQFALQQNEWFNIDQALACFLKFHEQSHRPTNVHWRDISEEMLIQE